MNRLAIIAVACLAPFTMAGQCATTRPEPRVEVREVKTVVTVKCNPDPAPKAPVLPDTDAALAAVPNVFSGAQLLKAGRRLRDAYIGELEAALKGCTG